ncbi:MAG: histidinol-phosphate transaminase [Puniceicoccales bacterium]
MSAGKDVFSLASPKVLAVDPYVPGAQINEAGWVKLNTNESPFPPSPMVIEAAQAQVEKATLYPDPPAGKLRERIAAHWGLASDQVVAGNGSDDILNLLIRVFSDGERTAAAMEPSYSLYPVLAAANGSSWENVPFEEPFRLPVEAIVRGGFNLFFLTCPHAPSGVVFPMAEIEELAERFEGILVVDEAYGDFAGANVISLLKRFPKLVVTRTFSKSFGLAGLRIGYGLGSPEVIGLLDRIRDSYNLDRVAQAAGVAALDDWGYYEATIGKTTYIRDFYRQEFEGLGWKVYPSQANFLFVRPEDRGGNTGAEVASSLFEFLKANKVLVRYFGSHALTRDFLRISIGDEDQMMTLWDTVTLWRSKE